MDPFHDKIAIVTGGASGIGLAVCKALARRDAVVIVADVDDAKAEEAARAITGSAGRARAVQLDVSDESGVRALVEETVAQHGRIDYMFNNAGIAVAGEERDVTLDHWRRMLDVNLWGVIYGTKFAYARMIEQGFGHIVNTASIAGLVPAPMLTAYAATKHAVVGLSTSLRAEACDLGVKVSVVCPGGVRTPLLHTMSLLRVQDLEALLVSAPFRFMDPALAARKILRGVARNRGIITFPLHALLPWWVHRLHAGLLGPICRRTASDFRAVRD